MPVTPRARAARLIAKSSAKKRRRTKLEVRVKAEGHRGATGREHARSRLVG